MAYLAMESEAARLSRVATADAKRRALATVARAQEALAGALRRAKAVDKAARPSPAGSQLLSVSACAPAIDLGDCARG